MLQPPRCLWGGIHLLALIQQILSNIRTLSPLPPRSPLCMWSLCWSSSVFLRGYPRLLGWEARSGSTRERLSRTLGGFCGGTAEDLSPSSCSPSGQLGEGGGEREVGWGGREPAIQSPARQKPQLRVQYCLCPPAADEPCWLTVTGTGCPGRVLTLVALPCLEGQLVPPLRTAGLFSPLLFLSPPPPEVLFLLQSRCDCETLSPRRPAS